MVDFDQPELDMLDSSEMDSPVYQLYRREPGQMLSREEEQDW